MNICLLFIWKKSKINSAYGTKQKNEGEEIEAFSLPSWACIYHFNDVEDARILESSVNDIEYVETERIDGMKYFRIGIMQDHQLSIIYFLEDTLPYKTEKWLEH